MPVARLDVGQPRPIAPGLPWVKLAWLASLFRLRHGRLALLSCLVAVDALLIVELWRVLRLVPLVNDWLHFFPFRAVSFVSQWRHLTHRLMILCTCHTPQRPQMYVALVLTRRARWPRPA